MKDYISIIIYIYLFIYFFFFFFFFFIFYDRLELVSESILKKKKNKIYLNLVSITI